MQYFFDIILSLTILIFLSVPLLLICIILKFTGESEIFYMQDRIGYNGKKFKIIKFATMLKNSPNFGSKNLTLKNDPRILPFGNFLRKTKINELPQLINVLKGEMSLVGPRPLTEDNFQYYSKKKQLIIQSVKPGITGYGSLVFRNEEELLDFKSSVLFYKTFISSYKSEIEEWYIKNKNLYFYFLCLILTIYIVIFQNNKIIWTTIKKFPKPNITLKKILKL